MPSVGGQGHDFNDSSNKFDNVSFEVDLSGGILKKCDGENLHGQTRLKIITT
jgi:hypothetical protein